jgi:hypothetical protein
MLPKCANMRGFVEYNFFSFFIVAIKDIVIYSVLIWLCTLIYWYCKQYSLLFAAQEGKKKEKKKEEKIPRMHEIQADL